MTADEPQVAIIGAGPAGAAAARALVEAGITDVTILEREAEPGGIPRFCDYPTFGLSEFGRLLTGPRYAEKLAPLYAGATLLCNHTVEHIAPDLSLTVLTPAGRRTIRPARLLLATGARETPRSARLISGDRPHGVLTTGALQRIVHSRYRPPFRTAVIVGTELVSFSVLLKLRALGIRPLAMIEAGERIVARRPAGLIASLAFGVAVRTRTRLVSIDAVEGMPSRLAGITIVDAAGKEQKIACDAVIFTGGFRPDAALLGDSIGELFDPGTHGPAIDQNWRMADPRIYAAGNVLRGVETAGWAFAEGRAAGRAIAADIIGSRTSTATVQRLALPVRFDVPIAYVIPSWITHNESLPAFFQMRVSERCSGYFELLVDGRSVAKSRKRTHLPERRILLRVPKVVREPGGQIKVQFIATNGVP